MSTDQPSKPNLIRATQSEGVPAMDFSHPLNPKSQVNLRMLGDAVGFQRLGVHLLRVPPGKESFVYHSHYTEEEFLYIVSGRAIIEIDGTEHEVGPGDFVGFPTPSVPHQLRNPFDEDVVYLAAGERHPTEIAEFPRLGKRLVRAGMAFAIHDTAGATSFPGMRKLGED